MADYSAFDETWSNPPAIYRGAPFWSWNGRLEPDRLFRWRKLTAENAFNSATLAERRTKNRAFGKLVRQVMKGAKSRHQP